MRQSRSPRAIRQQLAHEIGATIDESGNIELENGISSQTFDDLILKIDGDDLGIARAAADLAEKVTRVSRNLLAPHAQSLLRILATQPDANIRWHVIQMTPRVTYSRPKRKTLQILLFRSLDDTTPLVKTFAMQALMELAMHDPALMDRVLPRVHELTQTGTAAMKARGRHLLKQYERLSRKRSKS